MKFSNLDIQEIQKTGPAYIPVNVTSIDSDKKNQDKSFMCS